MTSLANSPTDRAEAPMRDVRLDGQDKAVMRFLLGLVREDAGSVLELAGRAVARVPWPRSRSGTPASCSRSWSGRRSPSLAG